MVAKYVSVFECSTCGKLYQEKQVIGCNNQHPTIPDQCTFIKDFDLVRVGREEIKTCGNKRFNKLERIFISGYRHHEEQDVHSMYLKRQLLSKFGK
jgi:hypothetical protein